MKNLLFIALLIFSFGLSAQSFDSAGKKISPKKAISTEKLVSLASTGKEIQDIKVKGEVASVCQAKGCWMKVKLADGNEMRVTFKDYGFFVPMDITGKEVVFQGVASVTETSVKELRHYAEDAGKSEEEIAKITEPKKELSFVADGVLIKN